MQVVDTIIRLFDSQGHEAYFGEPVSQREHALQAAYLAEQDGSPGWLIAAALLHDIGHLVHGQPEDLADRGGDGLHEDAGATWLAPHFGPDVVRPIRLHVAAKRYLCAVEPGYLSALSPASALSLRLQGGPMDAAEAARFASDPHHGPAIRLRRWDDRAKIPGLIVPGVEHYRKHLESAHRSQELTDQESAGPPHEAGPRANRS